MSTEFRLAWGGQGSINRQTDSAALVPLRTLSDPISEPHLKVELRDILREADVELRGAGLRNLAGRLERRNEDEAALALYQYVSSDPEQFGIQEARLAQERLAGLLGQGSFGSQFEIFARRFVRDVTDPATLAGMAFAGGIFQGLRVATYARLLSNPSTHLLTRGLGARALAFGIGFAAEAPAFSLASRSTNVLLNRRQDWSPNTLGHELAATYLTLGALRLSGAAGNSAFRRLQPLGNGAMPRVLFQQASMLGGITGAQWLEQELGWREKTSGAALLASSLGTLLHFNVAGRLLHGISGGEFTRRLQLKQERLESQPPTVFGRGLGTFHPGRRPALAEANVVFMSGIEGNPSSRPPPPLGSNEARGATSTKSSFPPPPPSRNVREDLNRVGLILNQLYDRRSAEASWVSESMEAVQLYQLALDAVRISEESAHPKRVEIINHLMDLSSESNLIVDVLTEARRGAEAHPVFSGEGHLTGQVIEQLYRSANNFINYLDNTGTIPEPLQHIRMARFWLQFGLEKATLPGTAPIEHGAGFPYRLESDGTYRLPPPERHVLIFGDENGPRTFQLAKEGHQVTHLDYDNSRLRTTQKLTDMRVKRAKSSGEWRFDLEGAAREPVPEFHTRIQDAQPAEVVEAYFPTIFETLKPRSDFRRMEQLRELIITNLTMKLKTEGTAFVISNRDDAVEDLARAVSQMPNLELLEVRQRQDFMPLRAGMHITAEMGDSLYSWLVFRRTR